MDKVFPWLSLVPYRDNVSLKSGGNFEIKGCCIDVVIAYTKVLQSSQNLVLFMIFVSSIEIAYNEVVVSMKMRRCRF